MNYFLSTIPNLIKSSPTCPQDPPLADLLNMNKDPSAGAQTITAAMFLKEFVKCRSWMHVDMAAIKHTNSSNVLGKGMTGRPLATMVKFIQRVFL